MKAPNPLRRLICLLICFAMVLQPMMFLTAAAESNELIVNGDFSIDADGNGKADGWSYWFGSVTECPSTIGEDGITIHADSTTETQRLTVHQTASLVAGKTYRLTMRYQVTSTARGSLEIRHNALGSNQRVAYHTSKTDGWQTVDTEFVAASGSMKLEIVVSQGATLVCSVDDVSLTEVVVEVEEPETAELLVNGNYADDNDDGKADSWNYWNGTAVAAPSACGEDGLTITADSTSETQRLTVHQTVTGLDASKTYRFTGDYNILSIGKGAFEIGYTPNATGSRNNAVKLYSKTDGWQSFDVTFTGCESVKVESAVSSGVTMTVQVNNFSLTEVVEEEPEDDGNLIVNPGYVTEDISAIPSWNYYPAYAANVGTNYTASVADGVFTGNVLGGSNLILHQTIPLTEDQLGKTYTFSGDIKTEGLSSYAMFKVYIQDASNKQLSSFLSSQVKGDADWTTLSVEFEVPAQVGGVDVASIKLEQYILKGTGTAHFCDPKIIKTGDFVSLPEGDPVDTLLKNGGYETTLAGFPASWNLWQSTGGLNAASDREVFKEGYSSLHLSNATEGKDSRGSVHQTFTITPELQELWGQSVKIGQWVKTKDFVGDALMFRVHYATVSGAYIAKSMPVKSTQDWTYYEYIIDLPDHFETIKVETLYEYAQGDVWIDNTTCWGYIKAAGLDVNTDQLVMQAGETFQLEIDYIPANTTVKEVTYASSNEAVMTVDPNGLVTAVADGYATVTITHVDGMKKEIAVLVTDDTIEYTEELEIFTEQNVHVIEVLPEGWNYTVTAAPQYGTFLVIDGTYYYYPAKDFYGEDSVTLLVENESGKALVIVPLFVEQVNAAPVFDNMNVLTYEDAPVSGKVTAVDPENDPIVYGIGTPCEHGAMTLEGNVYTYTPDAGFNGYDYITFTADDGNGNVTERVTTIYVAPDVQELLSGVKTEHSRLLADDARFEELKALLLTDENVKEWFAEVKATIDPLLEDPTPVPYHCPDDVRLDTQGSKDVLNLAFMYRMTGEQVYLDRAWVEMEALCGVGEYAYPDWHPSHLLDTAMTANGVAIAYDWLYDYLTAEQKQIAEKALYDYGLEEALYQFSINSMFVTNLNNWNYVCNGGFITTAMALAHHENETYNAAAGEVLQKCYQSVQWGLPQYAPEGDSIEGISYWDYGTRYLASMLASISSATNVPNPFLSAPGLDMTALYPIYMSGKAGTYNYSDNDMTDAVGYLNLWFAEVYGEPSWTWYHKYYMENDAYAATVYDLLYYNADYYESEAPEQLDAFYTSQAVTTMRSDFTDPNGSFLGFKGGLNGAAHGDIDIGSFVFDLFGERWAFDFGKEDYNLVGYWEIAAGGTRWNYYRKNALGHNTLVINPTVGANQTVGAYAGKVEQSINNPGGGYTILDMTDAYLDNAVAVKRGFAYLDREQVLIRDEYTLKAPGTTYWQMHTKADVSISEDGKTATLTLNGKMLLVKLFDENGSDLKFAAMAAKPYDAELTEGENINEGVTKLYIQADGVQTGVFNVLLTPADKADPEIKALENWSAYDFSKETEPVEPIVIASGWSGYTTWVLTDDGVITFTSSGEKLENGESNMKNYWKVNGVLTLPWSEYAEQITKVVINEGIHDIGQMAFYELPNLVEVVLPESAVEIRNYAFKNCRSLTTINLEVVDFIREGAFYGCSALKNVELADAVVIEDWAFAKTPVVLP